MENLNIFFKSILKGLIMEFLDTIQQRQSIKSYQTDKVISDSDLDELMQEVVLSPSSFNLQHWKFVAVKNSDIKIKLREAAWGQEHIESCSLLIAVCGKLNAFEDAPAIYQDVDPSIKDKVLPMIKNFYENKEQLQRDEATRSASLAAMTPMLGAVNRGWDTCPMIGFDPEAVSKILELDESHIPVMLLTLGYRMEDPRPRSPRRPISEVVKIDTLNGPGLMA
jgi:nitroreductase